METSLKQNVGKQTFNAMVDFFFFKRIFQKSLKFKMVLVLTVFASCTSNSSRNNDLIKRQNQLATYTTQNLENKASPNLNILNSTKLGLPELYEKCKPAVFLIYTSDGYNNWQGTGFFVSPNGLAVSNYHVFEGTWKGLEEITLSTGEILHIDKVYEISKENDYIIFKVKTDERKPYLFVASHRPRIGEEAFAIGNPKGLEHTLSDGIVSNYDEEKNYIQMTTEITHGSSGGPLFNMKGEVIGITSAGLGEANLNFAVDIQILELQRFY